MKRSLYLFIVLIGTIIFSSCSGNKQGNSSEPGIIRKSNDLEGSCWINPFTLVTDVAHSGKFSSRLDSINPYSFGYQSVFADISDTLPINVDVNLWLFYPQTGINGNLVMSIDSVNKNIFWTSILLKDSVINANQWKEIKATFEIPKNIRPTDNLKIYVWSTDKRSFYMDDINLVFHNQ